MPGRGGATEQPPHAQAHENKIVADNRLLCNPGRPGPFTVHPTIRLPPHFTGVGLRPTPRPWLSAAHSRQSTPAVVRSHVRLRSVCLYWPSAGPIICGGPAPGQQNTPKKTPLGGGLGKNPPNPNPSPTPTKHPPLLPIPCPTTTPRPRPLHPHQPLHIPFPRLPRWPAPTLPPPLPLR